MPVCKPDPETIAKAGEILRAGGLVAFPTETVYGLGANALDAAAAVRIYEAKGRPSDNPLIVHIADLESLTAVACEIPAVTYTLAEHCWPGPLTLILKKTALVPETTTGGLQTVAVRMPAEDTARALIRAAGGFVAAPSANRSGRPSPTLASHVEEDLGTVVDMILDGGRATIGLESTILDLTEEIPTILRPGFYSRDYLQEILGEVCIDAGLSGGGADVRPKAPGMRYRHYAPKAELVIIGGAPETAAEEIRRRVREDVSRGKRVGILCAGENRDRYPEGEVRCMGQLAGREGVSVHLYEALRAFDADGIERIYAEQFDTMEIGPAIMDRLTRAAGGKKEG